MTIKSLKAEELSWRCDVGNLTFSNTSEIADISDVIGQERALRSLDFGLGILDGGFNIYVLGESGTGKTSIVKARLEERASGEAVPDDCFYVFDFKDPDRPVALNLPPGEGVEFRSDMDGFIAILKRDIPGVFESKDYESHRDEILDGQQESTKAIFSRIEKLAVDRGFVLKKTSGGLSVLPGKDGKILKEADYDKLSRSERNEIDKKSKQLQDKLSDAIREARKLDKGVRKRIAELDQEVTQYVVKPHMDDLLTKYAAYEDITAYLKNVSDDIFLNIDDFRVKEDMQTAIMGIKMPTKEASFERYKINLIVDNSHLKGAPVVFETNPTYYNLFGRVEHSVQYGVATTDFTMIKSGSIQRANGGYLVLNAMDVLKNIFVYDALKRMIRTREVKVEDVWEQYKLVSTTTLKPEPIPVDIKIVLIGEPYIYYLLYRMDKEYRKLFKVKADFDSIMNNTEGSVENYAGFIASTCSEKGLLPFDISGVGAVVECGVKLAGSTDKISANFGAVENVIVEASYWAGIEARDVVTEADVLRAVEERKYRSSKIEDRIRELIENDTLMISTEGEMVGQINGMAVLSLGDYAFGKPSKVTAKTFMGDSGLVSIEREVKLSGKIHNKGQMIVKSFLGDRFARSFPISVSASICFEQLYDEIEGDSATCAEVYALMSSLSGQPIKQSIAVTGSMNQHGEVQPIGGVNEKIEGFFDVCVAKGLTGTQGVIIPKRNLRNLMLKKSVRDAVAEGKFFVYPIEMVDEGMEILTGKTPGERGAKGEFPKGTINRLVADKLHELATGLKAFGKPKVKHKAAPKDAKTTTLKKDRKK